MTPVTEVKLGDRLYGGIVTGIRVSRRRASIWFTMRDEWGEMVSPRARIDSQAAVFTEEIRAGEDLRP